MNFNPLSIEYLKSGLSVNTHIGCGLGCKYCVLSTGIKGFPNKPILINSPKTIIENLNSPRTLFVNGITPIYINNRTDPLLSEVAESTYELLDLMAQHYITSPITIISKLTPDNRFSDFASELNILYFYTYSGLTGIDYNSSDQIYEKSIETIRKNVPFKNRFHYFRPVIPNYNDSEEKIKNVLRKVKGDYRLTVAGGIRVNNENSKVFKISEYNKNHKLFSDAVWSSIIQHSKELQVSSVRHTSCAISIFMNRSNNLRYFDKHDHCIGLKCKSYELCKKERIPDIVTANAFLDRYTNIRYSWDADNTLVIETQISQEVIAFLRTTFGINCKAEEIILSPSEIQLAK